MKEHMKIGFLLPFNAFSPKNGVVIQSLTWKKGLEELGHEVEMFINWKSYDWGSYDVIVVFSFNIAGCEFIDTLYRANKNLVLASVLDPDKPITVYKAYSHWGSAKFSLKNKYYALRQVKDKFKAVLVRSEFEKKYMVEAFGFPPEKCHIVRLSHGVEIPKVLQEKENFCLHISLLCDPRKNVKRLIDASVKYQFKLVLAGNLRNEQERKQLDSWINGASNIEYKGFVTEEEKLDLYARAKVFALPSTNEGVGIVALEAAAYGCDIVITSLGGPHEYYADMAKVVNPYSMDEIGVAVKDLLGGCSYQPMLSEYIDCKYSLRAISKELESVLSLSV